MSKDKNKPIKTVGNNGTILYKLGGVLHREDGPAVTLKNRNISPLYYIRGKNYKKHKFDLFVILKAYGLKTDEAALLANFDI